MRPSQKMAKVARWAMPSNALAKRPLRSWMGLSLQVAARISAQSSRVIRMTLNFRHQCQASSSVCAPSPTEAQQSPKSGESKTVIFCCSHRPFVSACSLNCAVAVQLSAVQCPNGDFRCVQSTSRAISKSLWCMSFSLTCEKMTLGTFCVWSSAAANLSGFMQLHLVELRPLPGRYR